MSSQILAPYTKKSSLDAGDKLTSFGWFIGTALNVESVDLFKENNCKAHHTDEYEQDDLIVRRGQPFSLKMKFDRNINKNQDIIVIKFAYGMNVFLYLQKLNF